MGVEAAKRVTLEILTMLGDLADSITLVGGSTPPLLVGDQKSDPYTGTLDVDLLIDPIEVPEDVYAAIGRRLQERGYVPGAKSFQWLRVVQVDGTDVEVRVDLLAPQTDRRGKGHRHEHIDPRVVARRLKAGELVRESFEKRELAGKLPDGRRNTISVRIAAAASFVVLKALALNGRDKIKDPYDIDYVLKFVVGGPDAVAAQLIALGDVPIVKEALDILRQKFDTAEGYGPSGVAMYRRLPLEGDDAAAEMAQAYARVQRLLQRYDELALR